MAEHHDDEGGLIKTPKHLIIACLLGLFVPLALALLLSQLVTMGYTGQESSPEAVQERIQKVGNNEVAGSGGPIAAVSPEETYKTACSACHDSGAAGAPKTGDKSAWAGRISGGLDKLTKSAIKGKGAMPPKGGASVSDEEFARVVAYLANKSGANFK